MPPMPPRFLRLWARRVNGLPGQAGEWVLEVSMSLRNGLVMNPLRCESEVVVFQSRPQSEFVALPLLWDTRGRSVI